MADRSLNNRTKAEELWLWRRRCRMTQEDAARALGVGEKAYLAMEQGRSAVPGNLNRSVGDPTPGELCALARRRHGLRLRETAAMLGISHTTLLCRERLSSPALVEAWNSMGYR